MIGWKEIVAGGLTFLAAHAMEVEAWPWFDPSGTSTPWFLNAGRAVAFTAATLLIVGVFAGLNASISRHGAVARGGNIAAGAIVAMTIVLFAKGPGTLFPIALIIGAAIAVTSSVSGAMMGWRLASGWHVRRM
ncbi:MAG TPA: hypothetical protein VG222_09040 [Vicinamibacterales bacterium]|nr:hypothetical protein [Vicinamibacterales bacterium]